MTTCTRSVGGKTRREVSADTRPQHLLVCETRRDELYRCDTKQQFGIGGSHEINGFSVNKLDEFFAYNDPPPVPKKKET